MHDIACTQINSSKKIIINVHIMYIDNTMKLIDNKIMYVLILMFLQIHSKIWNIYQYIRWIAKNNNNLLYSYYRTSNYIYLFSFYDTWVNKIYCSWFSLNAWHILHKMVELSAYISKDDQTITYVYNTYFISIWWYLNFVALSALLGLIYYTVWKKELNYTLIN